MTDKIFLLSHVPKTSGTSLIDAMRDMIGAERCLIQSIPLDASFTEDFAAKLDAGYRFFSGHVPLPLLIGLKKRHPNYQIILMTSARDPLQHFFSLYLHGRHFDTRPLWRQVSIRGFLRQSRFQELRNEVFNTTTQYMSGKIHAHCDARAYKSALRNLEDVDFVFNSEDINRSCEIFSQYFDLPFERVSEKALNTNVFLREAFETDNIDLIPEIANLNLYDFHLFAHMRKMARLKQAKFRAFRLYDRFGKVYYVSEMIRRSEYQVDAQHTHFEFQGNDIFLHPPQQGYSSIRVKRFARRIEKYNISTTISLSAHAAGPVIFEIVAEDKSYLRSIAEILHPGENKLIEFYVDNTEEKTVSFNTRLKDQGMSNSFTWAHFKDIKLTVC